MINLYTQAQVQIALQRATVAMLLIDQKIASQFLYLNSPRYALYKNLQYDIFNLFSCVTSEFPYINFTAAPTTYSQSYYALVGVMIEKTKTVDVFGAYDGASNPNYQAPGTVVNIVNPIFYLPSQDVYYTDFDPASQLPDGGRTTYFNSLWKGRNPILSVNFPAWTRLYNGTDYSLVVNGGITLLSGGDFPEIQPGQNLVVTGFE
jgi:hypothetical protein